jgi:hypothetical protein
MKLLIMHYASVTENLSCNLGHGFLSCGCSLREQRSSTSVNSWTVIHVCSVGTHLSVVELEKPKRILAISELGPSVKIEQACYTSWSI